MDLEIVSTKENANSNVFDVPTSHPNIHISIPSTTQLQRDEDEDSQDSQENSKENHVAVIISSNENQQNIRNRIGNPNSPIIQIQSPSSTVSSYAHSQSPRSIALDPQDQKNNKRNSLENEPEIQDNFYEMQKETIEHSIVEFKCNIFLREILYNLFFPFSFPFIWMFEGFYGLKNRLYLGCNRTCFLQWIIAILFYTTNVLYAIYKNDLEISFAEIVLCDCLFLIRGSVIATKYAYMNSHILDEMRYKYVCNYKLQLIQGWGKLNLGTIHREINYSIARLRLNLSSANMNICRRTFFFHDIPAIQNRLKGLSECISEKDCPKYREYIAGLKEGRVHPRLMLLQLMLDSEHVSNHNLLIRHMMLLPLILSVFHALLPGIIRVSCRQQFMGSSSMDNIIGVACAFLIFYFCFANFVFMLLAIKDFTRRLYVMHECSDMLVERHKGFCGIKSIMPSLEYKCPLNMSHWFDMRMIAKDIGLNYLRRIGMYSSFFLCISLCLVLFLLYQFIAGSPDKVTLGLSFYDVIVVFSTLIYTVRLGKNINDQGKEHIKILVRKQAKLIEMTSLQKLHGRDDAIIYKINATIRLINSMLKVLETDDDDLQLLGFSASSNFGRFVATMAATGFGVGLRLIFQI